MHDTKHLLEQARNTAPETPFVLEDVHARRSRRERRRRLGATVVGLGIAAAIVGGVAFAMVSSGTDAKTRDTMDGGSLPAVNTVALGPGEFSYQRIRLEHPCGDCGTVSLLVESWWALDDSGRIDVLEQQHYGMDAGDFPPGEFPDEGDLSAFPLEPDALEAFLLERSGSNGASPRPAATPAPGVSVEEGQMWWAIHDFLGSTQYLNATPELRASMLQVLAENSMVNVEAGATDPVGRPATALRFRAYDEDVEVFVEPTTGDFLALTMTFNDESWSSVIVEEAGIVANDHTRPHGEGVTVPPAS